MVRHLDTGISGEARAGADAAVRECSAHLDRCGPEPLRLTCEQIDGDHEQVCQQALEDLRFARAQKVGTYCSRLGALEPFAGHQEQADIRLLRHAGLNMRGLDALPGDE